MKSIHLLSSPVRGCCVGELAAIVAISPSLSYLHFAILTPTEQSFGRAVCSVVKFIPCPTHALSREAARSTWG